MKPQNLNYTKFGKTAIDRIIDWVERRGVSKFLEGYLKKRKYPPRQYAKLLLSIAWGISIKRTNGKFRRKQWWNKSKTAAIADLVSKIAAQLPDTATENIVDNLKKK